MLTVNIYADGASLSAEQPIIADGTAGGMTARFCTDSLWHGLTLTAVFRTQKGDILMPLTNGQCEIPFEAAEKCGDVLVGLFGTDGYRTLTSLFCRIRISPGVPTNGEEAANYTPSLYEQFAAKFSRIENMTVSAEKGEAASVSVSDNADAFNLHFTLPKGDRGAAGEKGPQGEKGDKGDRGPDGRDGYTPQKGIDYMTGKDKNELKAAIRADIIDYIDATILGGAW